MNCFVFWQSPAGHPQLITPPLTDGTILPGVTRDSILQLCRQWGEFEVLEAPITMPQIVEAIRTNRLFEMFGSGTAAVISPIRRIHYQGKDWHIPLNPRDPNQQAGPLANRLWEAILKIQYGEVADHPWSVIV